MQGTDIQSAQGTGLYISAGLPATYDAAGYSDSNLNFTQIGRTESITLGGVTFTVTPFTDLFTGQTAKVKGVRNEEDVVITMAYVPSDAGQILLLAALESLLSYSFKVVFPLRPGETSAEKWYYNVLVSKTNEPGGDAAALSKLGVTLSIRGNKVVVAAS